jgi:hypothetical protein
MGKKLIILVWIVAFVATLFIAISPQSLSLPPSAHTNLSFGIYINVDILTSLSFEMLSSTIIGILSNWLA